ncbi:MAG: AAA family ATPase [Rhodothermales bacterium]
MRIKRCDIKAFGQFKDQEFEDLNHPMVVVYGENEAGKSTFFQFLRSMLYGFYPDQAEQYKYAPLDGSTIEGQIAFSTSHSDEIVVSRRLDKMPSGFLLNGSRDELGNRSLPILSHISRPVFESVYTLGLYDMMEFSGEAWEKIQDRLLGSLNDGHVRPAKDVIRVLEQEADSLWQTGLQRNSLARQLDVQQRDLKKMVLVAKENDEKLRVLSGDVDAFVEKEKALENEQIQLKAERRRVKRLIPIHRLTNKIAGLREKAGDLEPYRHIPEESQVIVDTLSEQISKDQDKLDYARRDIRYAQAEIQKFSRNLLTEPLTKDILQSIRDLPDVELRHHVYACQEALGSLREVQMYAKMLSVRVSVSKPLYPWLVLALCGVLMVLAGLFWFDETWLWISGLVVALFGGIQVLEASRHNRTIGYDEAEEWPEVADFEIEAELQKQAIIDLLEKIPLPSIRLENPDLELVSDLETMKSVIEDYDHQVRDYTDQDKDFRIRNRSALSKIKQLKEPLLELGEGDVNKGSRRLMERRKAARQAAQYEETLQQDHPDWLEMQEEIEAIQSPEADVVFSDEEVIRIESRLEQIEIELKEVVATRIDKSKDIERLGTERSMDSIESEIALIKDRHQELKQRRDRLQLLANVLKKAEQQFRMKHQPEVIRLAGEYLSQVTNNRYSRLGMEEETGRLVVYEGDSNRSFPVGPPLSQGTCDQIFLAIRLAIIDHLDDGKERVPVFLDEVFVNWDASRRKNVYGILKKMSENRQVFLFTCHEWQAEEAEEELGAHSLMLLHQN